MVSSYCKEPSDKFLLPFPHHSKLDPYYCICVNGLKQNKKRELIYFIHNVMNQNHFDHQQMLLPEL